MTPTWSLNTCWVWMLTSEMRFGHPQTYCKLKPPTDIIELITVLLTNHLIMWHGATATGRWSLHNLQPKQYCMFPPKTRSQYAFSKLPIWQYYCDLIKLTQIGANSVWTCSISSKAGTQRPFERRSGAVCSDRERIGFKCPSNLSVREHKQCNLYSNWLSEVRKRCSFEITL